MWVLNVMFLTVLTVSLALWTLFSYFCFFIEHYNENKLFGLFLVAFIMSLITGGLGVSIYEEYEKRNKKKG